MDGETTTQVAPAASQSTPKTRAPIDPAKRAAMAQKRVVTQLLSKAKDSKNRDELFAKLDELRGKESNAAKASVDGGPAQAPKVGSAPGWPTDAEIAAALPVTSQIWAQAKLALHGSMFQLDEPVDVEVTVPDLKADPSGATMCRKTVTIDPVGQLATGTAPAYAKIAGGAFTNPYAMAGIVVGGVFGPKLAQLGFMAVRAWLDKPKAEPTKTQNAPVLTAAEVKK